MNPSKLEKYFDKYSRVVNKALLQTLPSSKTTPQRIHEAMRYSVEAGGKRLRPLLVFMAAEACGGKAQSVLPAACALELIHTYSLIHDDLPALDNDDLRRGLPTSHKKFGEDMAILAGDGLLTHAFHLLSLNANVPKIKPEAVLKTLRMLSYKAGTQGMIGGQVVDIQADKGRWKKFKVAPFNKPNVMLQYIHENKTAALIQASVLAGGMMVSARSIQLRALEKYGFHLGLAFQITDDILDVVGDKKKLGKKGSDQQNQKLTYPALFGIQNSTEKARFHIEQSIQSLNNFSSKAENLRELARFVLHREH